MDERSAAIDEGAAEAGRGGAAEAAPPHAPTVSLPGLLIDGSDLAFRGFINDLLIVAVRLERLRDRIGALAGLSGMQYHILMVVAELGARRPVTVSAVAETLQAKPAHVTMEAGKLARRGLIAKRRNPADGRSVLLSVAPAGRAAIEALAPDLRAINDALFEGLDGAGFDDLRARTARLVGTTAKSLRVAGRIAEERGEQHG